MQIDADRQIREFVEKPQETDVIDSLRIPAETRNDLGLGDDEDQYLASMGIYVFNRDVMLEYLDSDHIDFGKHIIPEAIDKCRSFSYVYQGYWEDVGRFERFSNQTSMRPVNCQSSISLTWRPRSLPGPDSRQLVKLMERPSITPFLSDGCIINRAQISDSIVGVRSVVGDGTMIQRVVMMGADYYESADSIDRNNIRAAASRNRSNTRIQNAIIDKNARIGNNCIISPAGKEEDCDGETICS